MKNSHRQHMMQRLGNLLSVLSLTFILLLIGCSGQQQESAQPTDSEVRNAVLSKIQQAQGLPLAKTVKVQVDSGVVVLEGQSDNLLAKDRATRVAQSVSGVLSVVNNLTVQSSRSDVDILADVRKALTSDPATDDWDIQPKVTNHHVTLTGTVESWQEKELADVVVKRVDGVTGITNNITVHSRLNRPDSLVAQDVRASLKWDSRIDAKQIHVNVKEHEVTLSGKVGSALEKSIALKDAYVAGASYVDTDQLTVAPQERSQMEVELTTPVPDDQVERAIREAMKMDPRLSAAQVNVSVVEGHVTLTGMVDNLKAKRSAASDAKNTLGVWSVENAIRIEPVQPVPDSQLQQRIEAALQRDTYVNPDQIRVQVNNGTVTLSGEADTYFMKWQVGDAVASLNNVLAIKNNITVPYEQPAYDMPFYNWNPVTNDYDVLPVEKTDAQIANDIRNELSWSPFVNERDIHVTVEDGVATLTGTIHTWYQKQKATNLAYQGGAREVKNNLKYAFGPLEQLTKQ